MHALSASHTRSDFYCVFKPPILDGFINAGIRRVCTHRCRPASPTACFSYRNSRHMYQSGEKHSFNRQWVCCVHRIIIFIQATRRPNKAKEEMKKTKPNSPIQYNTISVLIYSTATVNTFARRGIHAACSIRCSGSALWLPCSCCSAIALLLLLLLSYH